MKPYDNQLNVPSDELIEMYLSNEHNATPIKMLIGDCDIQKENWIKQNKKDGDVIIMAGQNYGNSLFARWRLNRDLNKQIKFAREKARRIIWFCGGFNQKDRNRVLKHLPEYRKYAIVWEQNVSDMKGSGYERPTSDEGFDEFTYIVS